MGSIISFLITIAFYVFIFRVIKTLAGKGKKAPVVKTKKTVITFGNKTGGGQQMPGFLKGLLSQTGLDQIMQNLEEQEEKLNKAQPFGSSAPVYEVIEEDYEKNDKTAYKLEPRQKPAPANTAYSTKEKSIKKAVISQKDLKKAVIYSEIIAPPLAFRQ